MNEINYIDKPLTAAGLNDLFSKNQDVFELRNNNPIDFNQNSNAYET